MPHPLLKALFLMNSTHLDSALSKATLRLLPFLFLLYIVAYLDRINVSFAALTMNRDLGLDQSAYGFGAGIFFLGYVLFEIPSNLILEKTGPRRWMARILVSWGVCTMALAWVQGAWSFVVVRFLLGVAEAGFFPGIILYLTYWFPKARRAKAVALFMTATAAAGLIGSPVSVGIMQLDGILHLAGWQWLFLLEGLPAVILGFVVWFFLPDGPQQAGWLTPRERQVLLHTLESEKPMQQGQGLITLRQGLLSPRVWALGLTYFSMVLAMYGLVMWLPQIVAQKNGHSALSVGFYVMTAYFCAAASMVAVGYSSDKHGERRWHCLGSMGLCLTGMLVVSASTSLAGVLCGSALAAMGIWSVLGPFWGLATAMLSGTATAAAVALINSLGNIGGFVGPYLVGWVQARTGHYAGAFLWLAAVIAAGALPLLLMRRARPSSAKQGL